MLASFIPALSLIHGAHGLQSGLKKLFNTSAFCDIYGKTMKEYNIKLHVMT